MVADDELHLPGGQSSDDGRHSRVLFIVYGATTVARDVVEGCRGTGKIAADLHAQVIVFPDLDRFGGENRMTAGCFAPARRRGTSGGESQRP